MSEGWECPCGVSNRESKVKCRACGTPKGMVWTPVGFKTSEEAASLGEIKEKQGYLFGWFFAVGYSILAIFFLMNIRANPAPVATTVVFLIMGFLASAAGLRKPWGWYVLVVFYGFTFVASTMLLSALLVLGEIGGAAGSLMVPVGGLVFFVYFYKRRAMFGAKGRWKWFERTFPSFVGPEEEAPVARVQPESQEVAASTGKAREDHAHPKVVAKEPDYLNKQCPRCGEQIQVEATQCQYCGLELDREEAARFIASIFDEFGQIYDLKSATKPCPDCAESIKLEALICRYCRRSITSTEVQISKMKALREKIKAVRREMEGKRGR